VRVRILATATRPISANGLGWSVSVCQSNLKAIQSLFQFLPDMPKLYEEWESLVVQYACHGRIAFYARLVAAMRTHDITKILTFNVSDFVRFPNLQILDSNAVVSTP
jgi:hypothetical protein